VPHSIQFALSLSGGRRTVAGTHRRPSCRGCRSLSWACRSHFTPHRSRWACRSAVRSSEGFRRTADRWPGV